MKGTFWVTIILSCKAMGCISALRSTPNEYSRWERLYCVWFPAVHTDNEHCAFHLRRGKRPVCWTTLNASLTQTASASKLDLRWTTQLWKRGKWTNRHSFVSLALRTCSTEELPRFIKDLLHILQHSFGLFFCSIPVCPHFFIFACLSFFPLFFLSLFSARPYPLTPRTPKGCALST